MGSTSVALLAFNRGRLSPLALARTDFKRTALSAEVQTNFMPRALGSMTLRPGLKRTGATKSNLASITIPFVFSHDDTARIELTSGVMRVWVDDALVTRPTVTTTLTNGSFTSNVSGWTDLDAGDAVSVWATGGYLSLLGDGENAAKRRQTVSVTGSNIGKRHALNIVIERGPVTLRVGSTPGGEQYITETTLYTGTHSLAFTPSGSFTIDLASTKEYVTLVNSCTLASAGTMELAAPWTDLSLLRWDQSGDVVFVAASGYRQRRIERRAVDSWSIVTYISDNGPFRLDNIGPITIAPSDVEGDITLTASAPLFRATQVGALFRLTQTGQSAVESISAEDTFSDSIRVTGVEGSRVFAILLSGTWVGTVTLQYSVGIEGSWVDADLGTWTANTAQTYDDTLDNQIIYYRVGVKAGDYTSGTVEATLSYTGGEQSGIARITSFSTSQLVNAQVLEHFGNVEATDQWAESYWSDYRGYPSSVAFHEGRLWWAGKDRVWGSVSDDFANFDDTTEGDSGPISRSIGSGPVDKIHWLMSASRLLMGADCAIHSIRSSSLDEPLTPTNFNIKQISTQGAKSVAAVKIDTSAVFIQRSGTRAYEAAYDSNSYDYAVSELTQVIPEICEPGVTRIAVQHQPEKRVHCVRSDGTVALLCYDKQEEVTCWIDIETDGMVEDAIVLPGDVEDQVYYTVARTVDGSTVRFHEKYALESECRGFPEAKLADAFIEWTGAAGTEIDGLGALEGCEVVAWGWNTEDPFTNADGDTIGRDLGTYTVSGGTITVGDEVTNAVVGLGYRARYKSTKLAYGAQGGTALTVKKRVGRLGLIARWLHAMGLSYGPDFDTLDPLPDVVDGADVDANDMHSEYDDAMFGFAGSWDTDSRVCLEANAPRPATVLALTLEMETSG
jgi:hypothetical protein